MASHKRNTPSLILGFCIMLFSGVFYAWSLFRVELQAMLCGILLIRRKIKP